MISFFDYIFLPIQFLSLSIELIHLLKLIIFFLPLFAIFYLLLSDLEYSSKKHIDSSKIFPIAITILNLILLGILYQKSAFLEKTAFCYFKFSNFIFVFSLDNLSFLLISLTTFLTLICMLISIQIKNSKSFYIILLIIQFILFLTWTIRDIFFFYICFEAILIPMFLLIVIWGSRTRKYRASYMFFMYTLIGSISMLISIFYIFITKGTTNLDLLMETSFSFQEEIFLWFAIFIGMAVKIPIFPVHSWLPEAHVEAPTAGSVLLAGILLKLGGYGIIRFLLPIFPNGSIYFSNFIFAISLSSILYASFCALRQNDLKRIIAYASIAHMNLIVLGLFSFNKYALNGSLFQMISHGLVATLLFTCIGFLYDRSQTRLVPSYSGLVGSMPKFVSVFTIGTFSNMAMPLTCSFIGEFLIFFGIYDSNIFIGMLAALGIFLGGTYSILLYARISYGNSNLSHKLINKDLTEYELLISLLLIIPIIFLGLQPNYIFL